MNPILRSLLLLSLTAVASACGGTHTLTVVLPDGPVLGQSDGSVQWFKGVPYAAPPVGPLRFAPPQQIAPWTDVLDATKPGAPCAQLKADAVTFESASSEDCLYLNVWAPDEPGLHPVMLWIPGGGYVLGHGAQAGFDGHQLAEQRHVVVVTINYRLAAFGFMSHAALRMTENNTGNVGLLDQREALRWVQRNIAAVNGDPNDVTLFGESAGGGSTCMHMVSPGSVGLFHRAIIESGPCTVFEMPSLDAAEAQANQLSTALGCTGAPADVVACMRAAPTVSVLTALLPYQHFIYGDGVPWYPVVDGVVVPDRPLTLLANGASVDVPLIIGANSDEAEAFFAGADIPDATSAQTILTQIFGAAAAQAAIDYYTLTPDPKKNTTRMVSDAMICDARRVARLHTAAGRPTFQYHFTQAFFGPLLKLGAFHTAEIGYVFGNGLLISIPPAGIPLKNAMQGYWTGFAKAGDPNGGGRLHWPLYDPVSDVSIRLDLEVSTVSGVQRDACDFWDTQRQP